MSIEFQHEITVASDDITLGKLVPNDTSIVTGMPMAWSFESEKASFTADELRHIADRLDKLNDELPDAPEQEPKS